MGSVEKFYSIIEEKQSDYKNVFEFLRTFISSEKEVSYTASRIRIDKKGGRLPPVGTMIKLAPLFDKTFFETCLREKMDSAKIRDSDVEVGQGYLLKIDSTQISIAISEQEWFGGFKKSQKKSGLVD